MCGTLAWRDVVAVKWRWWTAEQEDLHKSRQLMQHFMEVARVPDAYFIRKFAECDVFVGHDTPRIGVSRRFENGAAEPMRDRLSGRRPSRANGILASPRLKPHYGVGRGD